MFVCAICKKIPVGSGQTGSGKTHTIMGGGTSTAMMQDEHQGVLPRAIRSIFQQLQKQQEQASRTTSTAGSASSDSSGTYEYDVRVQFLEIYGEEIRDLLNPRPQTGTSTVSKLTIRDVGNEEPEVVGATMHKVESAEEALLCLTSGMYRRVTASTAMNEGSSRSHAILSLVVEQSTVMHADEMKQTPKSTKDGEKSQIPSSKEHVQSKTSRFNFVDLAGSERQKRTQATGERLKEGININKGLLVLGNVISALGDPKKRGKTFVPYRDSKLTRLLKGSLGGNHKTLMIACVSPSSSNMEETLNCLRYANRAKNIQNNAVINLDSTSQLVADLKGKIQRLAMDLVKVKSGKADECTFPMSVIESLAEGDDAGDIAATTTRSLDGLHTTAVLEAEDEAQKLRAENESYRIRLKSVSQGKDPSDALQEAYMTKVTEYERDISRLKNEIQSKRYERSSPQRGRRGRSESPEYSRLKSQMFGSMSRSITLDAEVKAEEEAAQILSDKYIKHPLSDGEFVDDDCDHPKLSTPRNATATLDADLFELSNNITAKETLISQLQITQEKFETMREFYEAKLREMVDVLAVKEAETEKLSDELKKLGEGHSRGKELLEKLKNKQAQVADLKRKQSELSRLTNVASRNECQIARLENDVREMKIKKIDLQKQITSERKSHITEVRKMKKESMQKDRELNKAKREVNKKSHEASKAQKIAKARLEQMNHLRVKYKDTEKRLRMKTVKHGVLKKAGLDPIIFGRRQSEDKNGKKRKSPKSINEDASVDKLRDFFDKKVADVGRRENLAEKLAQEWEEHLELSIQKEELLQTDEDPEHESLNALDSAIKYREERIRQLASKLGKREKRDKENRTPDEALIFNKEFNEIVGTNALDNGADVVAKVLFGMVVRERRRIASLARTASSLDEKIQETESILADKEAAFNVYVGEQRLDAAALAQNQQEHILSLMEMVKEGHAKESSQSISSPGRSDKRRLSSSIEDGNSRLLLLANERIDVLERQLNETQLARTAVQTHQEREQSALSKLSEKTRECEELVEELDDLRNALSRAREDVEFDGHSSPPNKKQKKKSTAEVVDDIVTGVAKYNRRRSIKSRRGQSSSLKRLRIETEVDSSDSEVEEVPDWAEDIMADLAIIADGKMPSSLLQSQEVLEAEAKLGNSVFDRLTNPQSFTGVQKHAKPTHSTRKIDAPENSQGSDEKEKKAEKPTKKSKEKAPKNTESTKRNVFDRLLSPSNLTGTQKQRFNRIQDKKGRDLEKAIENQHVSVRGRPQVRENPSDETEEDGGWTAQNDDEFSLQRRDSELSENRNEMQSSNKKDEYSKLDVFERLNKKTTQAYKEKRHSNIAETMLDDCLAEEEASQESAKFEPRLERVKEYESRNVFERLQKTTTESYAKKKNAADTLLDDLLSDDDMGDVENDESTKFEPSSKRVKEYERRNVFERLQRTTTESYAKKKNNDVLDDLLADEDTENEESTKFEPSSERVKEYESRNVFERLQRTTTESYAKKKNSSMEDAHRDGSPVRKNSDWSISSPKNAARKR
jgi:kinesin family protein 4/21/27